MLQYLIVYLIVALAVWQLLRKVLPARKKKAAGKSCSACTSCGPDESAADWAGGAAKKPVGSSRG
ncbi:MAG TPA: FeoB-associated Cys-rich membrane protein [Candidatus Xenobia bacterium]|jgi:hypothetical protein